MGTATNNETGSADAQGFSSPTLSPSPPQPSYTLTVSGQLLADRNGNGTGRIYTVPVTVTDAAGITASCTATVTVPHDQGEGR